MQFLPFGGLCQFLIGNVKHLGLDAERKAEKCQFLIGNVKREMIPQKPNTTLDYVSIPHR